MLDCVFIDFGWKPITKNHKRGVKQMSKFISIGIDIGADFSFMSIILPDKTLIGKPFKILHNSLESLEKTFLIIKKAEELHSMKTRIIMESTGIYHYPLYCYLRDKGFNVAIINPLISKSSTNINIRKMHNDSFDSKKLAEIGLKPDLKTSVLPRDSILNLRNLVRNHYNLMDSRIAYVNKLSGILRIVFPQYIKIFSKITAKTSLALLEKYTSPDLFCSADRDEVITLIIKTSKAGKTFAEKKYKEIIQAANAAKIFGFYLSSNSLQIRQCISFIKIYDEKIDENLCDIHNLTKQYAEDSSIKQIELLESVPGIGFLSAITLICEIEDVSTFKNPKKLFAYFGLDPSVRQSGNFTSRSGKMSKRGSRIARRTLYIIAIVNIAINGKKKPNNPVLYEFYKQKCLSKPKKVALGAVMHKLCNIIFAVLRDNKAFVLTTAEEHKKKYLLKKTIAA
jgi:transposase